MIELLPPDAATDLSVKPFSLSEQSLARADGAVLLLDRRKPAEKALGDLPHAALWRALLRAQLAWRSRRIPHPGDAPAQPAPYAGGGWLRQARRVGLRTAGTRGQAGASRAATRGGQAASACRRRRAWHAAHRGTGGRPQRGARARRPHARAQGQADGRIAPRAGLHRRPCRAGLRPQRRHRGRQSPGALACRIAAQRARFAGVPAGLAEACDPRRLDLSLLRHR